MQQGGGVARGEVMAGELQEILDKADLADTLTGCVKGQRLPCSCYACLKEAAEFGLAVLWGSDGDKRGAIRALERALGRS